MRSRREILFRLNLELHNLRMLAARPALPRGAAKPGRIDLPDPTGAIKSLRGTSYAAEIERLAEKVLRHQFPLLGFEIQTGEQIDWRRDYVHDISTGAPYFRRVPYLDFARSGDHKIVWELNRHQHLVVLAQAFRLTGNHKYLEEIVRQVESWLAANPFLRGINWTSALEVAFRALSWVWVIHLAGFALEPQFREALFNGLYLHGCYLEHNLSVYFSPNTHLLGEAVALHALGALFPEFPGAARWAETGARIVREQMQKQVREDGAHFEQSTYYHLYALDLFLLHYLLAQTPPEYQERLQVMAEYLDALLGSARELAFFGDDDGGRVFHPYGARARFGNATLATCAVALHRSEWLRDTADLWEQAAWWTGACHGSAEAPGPRRSRLFAGAGTVVMAESEVQVIVKAGPFGSGSGGHSHADCLSLVCRAGAEEVLIDPGTYTYIAEPVWREAFRGAAAHNNVRIDGRDQAAPAGPFRWNSKPEVRIREWLSDNTRDYLDASCKMESGAHRRRVLFLKPDLLFVLDEVTDGGGERVVEQFWHLANQSAARRLALTGSPEQIEGWRSPVFGVKQPAPVLRVSLLSRLPVYLAAAVDLSGTPQTAALEMTTQPNGLALVWRREPAVRVSFPESGMPDCSR